ncbi:MAG: class I SAM-dependent methyltransferase [Lysobacteraceae bacterium]
MKPLVRLRGLWSAIEPGALALRAGRCPFCGPSLMLRLADEETRVRCLRCGASAIHLSMGWSLLGALAGTRPGAAYELSSRGALVRWLRRRARSLQCSEFFDDVPPGGERDGVRCEDVQQLRLPDACFDLVTHTEVFEHVPDDAAGLRELHRVLRPGGLMVFTVPMSAAARTVERARSTPAGVEHLLPPAYHGDRIRGEGRVLVYRDYGLDLVERVAAAGFDRVRLDPPDPRVPWNHGRRVVVATKEA